MDTTQPATPNFTPQPQPINQQLPPKRHNHVLLITLVIATILSLSATAFLLFRTTKNEPAALQSLDKTTQQQPAQITGNFNINGVIPDGATILIEKTNLTQNQGKTAAANNIPAVDEGSWSFTDVTAGETYEVTASVVVGGNIVTTSAPVVITAPATEESLVLNIPTANPQGDATINGTIQVHGYIPSGATINVQGRKLGETSFTTVAEDLPGELRQYMSYTTAIAGQTYEIFGSLVDADGNQIGSSSLLVITAPARNELLTINSQAIPPPTPTVAPTATPIPQVTSIQTTPTPTATPTPAPTPLLISGSIDFNGVAPANSRIVILQKVYNTQNYQVAVDNITPANGTTWQWTGPANATWYDVIAILKQKQPNGTDTDVAGSQVQSIAAPAAGVTFTINSGITIGAPSGSITANCGNLSGSTWNGQLSFANVSNAQTYWLQLGTSNGGNDVLNTTQAPNSGSNQTANLSFNNGTTYYARYAYAIVPNAGQNQFSPFSLTTQIRCSQ